MNIQKQYSMVGLLATRPGFTSELARQDPQRCQRNLGGRPSTGLDQVDMTLLVSEGMTVDDFNHFESLFRAISKALTQMQVLVTKL